MQSDELDSGRNYLAGVGALSAGGGGASDVVVGALVVGAEVAAVAAQPPVAQPPVAQPVLAPQQVGAALQQVGAGAGAQQVGAGAGAQQLVFCAQQRVLTFLHLAGLQHRLPASTVAPLANTNAAAKAAMHTNKRRFMSSSWNTETCGFAEHESFEPAILCRSRQRCSDAVDWLYLYKRCQISSLTGLL
jgi:hypothetical protein